MASTDEKPTHNRASAISVAIRELLDRRGMTQDDLATDAGLSRVQINRILNGGWAKTRPETRAQILGALVVSEEDLLGIDSLQQYRAFVLKKHRLQSLAGLGFAEHHRRPLDSFYVPPNAVCVVDKKSESDRFDEEPCDQPVNQEEPKSAVELISKVSRSVVLGVPGAGKTTLLNYMASKVANDGLAGTDVPIVVRLPEFALAIEKQPELDFIDWAVSRAEEARCSNTGPALQDKLLSDPATMMFLLDGLDEVPLGRREDVVGGVSLRTRVIRAIERFMKKSPDAKYVLTSRINGFDPSPWSNLRFEQFRLLEYGEEQIREVVDKWSVILATSKAEAPEKISTDLADAIFGNARVNQLARNPLILTVLILMCKSRGYALPRRRVDLYAKITEVFLDTWDASKQKEFGFREVGFVDLDPRELNWLIAELALAMQRASLVTAHRWWIVDHLHETLCSRIGFDANTAKEQTDPILTFLSERAGLLEQRMPGVYAFTHRTMQEYFAAIGLEQEAEGNASSTSSLPGLMRSYLFHPEWSEVVRLVAAHVSPARAEELLRVIADDADPTGRFLRRGPLLALRCLTDGATVPSRQFTQSVFDSFQPLGESPWYWLTLELLEILPAFDGTRHQRSAQGLKVDVLDRAKDALTSYDYRKLELFGTFPDFESWQPTDDEKTEPILSRSVVPGGDRIFIANVDLANDDPATWLRLSIKKLKDEEFSSVGKRQLLGWLQWHASEEPKSSKTIVKALKAIIASGGDSRVRGATVATFAELGQTNKETPQLLLSLLQNTEETDGVRAAAVRGLCESESVDAYESMLVTLLRDADEPEQVRVASAQVLEKLVSNSLVARDAVLAIAQAEPDNRVGMSCVYALKSLCPELIEQYQAWSRDGMMHSIEACLILSDAFISGGVAWDLDCVLELEERLIAVGQGHGGNGKPCQHMFEAVNQLCNARERLTGVTIDSVLRDALKPLGSRIVYGFVYGSTARNAQNAESDIDLMLLGDVTQRDLGGLIKKAESILGRELRPTTFTLDDFAEKFRQGNRFASEVMEKPKKFIEICGVVRTEEDFRNDIGTVEKEQLAS
ncbi:MAG: NACHT domain-containing protein [Pirellulaceae bacterium]